MSDHRPREIQLTSKQLVFVFMSTVLVAVVVFLLGVWVGRGIDTGSLAATDDVVGKSVPPATPASTDNSTPAAPPLTYPEALQGRQSGPGAPPPASSQPASPSAPPDPPPPPASPPAETKQPEKPQPETPQAATKSPADEEWVVQVGSYSAKAGADKVAAEFRGMGYPVNVTPGPKFRVWLGPYSRATADQIRARLRKEGRDSSVTKSR